MFKYTVIERTRHMIDYIFSIKDINEREKYNDLLIFFRWRLNYFEVGDDEAIPMLIDANISDLEEEISKLTFVT